MAGCYTSSTTVAASLA